MDSSDAVKRVFQAAYESHPEDATQIGQLERGWAAHTASAPKPFVCRRCRDVFTPQKGQWIFFDLCDHCFGLYDARKMRARVGKARPEDDGPDPEDVLAWMQRFPYQPGEPDADLDWIDEEATDASTG